MVRDLPRMTLTAQLVLRALLEQPTKEMYGVEICAAAGLRSGTIHPILARWELAGVLESRWEEVEPREEGRPRRRYYRIAPDAVEFVRNALARAYTSRAHLAQLQPNTAREGS
jgi:PadR family transcriptional regulator, regulatory protein PadR